MMKRFFLILILFSLFVSCRKKELPVSKPDPGAVKTRVIDMSSTYENQFYFDLSTDSIVGTGHKTAWDLGFSCAQDSTYIVMNSGKVMLASRVTTMTFDEINSTANFNVSKKADYPSGFLDSLGVRGSSVFILDRGYDVIGNQLGYFKMEILEHTTTHFKGRFANIDGSNEQTINIPKNTTHNYVYMKWNPSSAITFPIIEPEKTKWDLVFRQFTDVFYEPGFMSYSVVGCLTNSYNTYSLYVANKAFAEVDYSYAASLVLTNSRSEIGYTWKSYDIATGIYTIHPDKTYVIKDQEGNFFKIRFIDFFNQLGVKGAPTFEYQKL